MSEPRALLKDAAWLREGALARLLDVLDRDGEEARVVGGAVRNALLGEPISEFDIATTAVPDEVIRRATAAGFKPVPTGIEHGTITVVIDSRPFEVTTLREDVETFGRHANVRFGRDWRADAERRDFTMNALSAAADGVVHDYVGGLADLEARRVRFIGEAQKRIAEDYLRILRFFRFHAAYGHGAARCRGPCRLHRRARRPRAIVARAGADGTAQAPAGAARDAGARGRWRSPACSCSVLGGVPDLAGFENMAKVETAAGVQADAVQRLGALGARIAEDAERLWQRLRLSNAEHERLASMAEAWWRISPDDEKDARALLYRLGPERFVDRVLLAWARSPATRARSGLARAGERCPSTGPRRCFRSRPPISSSAACRRGRRSARPCMRPRRPGSRRIFRPIGAAIAAIADAAAADVRPM